MGERWADNQFTFNNFNIEDVVIHQTNGLRSQLGVGFKQLLFLDTGQNQFCCQPRRVGSKKASTCYRPLQSFLAQYSAVDVPYLHRPAAFWDRWIRILRDISAKLSWVRLLYTSQSRPGTSHLQHFFKTNPLKRGIKLATKHCSSSSCFAKQWCRCGVYPPNLFSSLSQIV